jgi:hypothetical protein
MSLANTDRVIRGVGIHRGEVDRFHSVLSQDARFPWSRLHVEALRVFEDALDLHFQTAAFAIAQVGGYLEPAIVRL